MMNKFFYWCLLMLGLVFLSACAVIPAEQMTTDVNNAETRDPIEEEETASPNLDPDRKSTLTPESHPEVTNAEDLTLPILTQDMKTCDDVFEGVNIRFSTTGWETNFCMHSVPYETFLSGGPPRDGIPPIDEPKFESLDGADGWLEEQEPVIGLELNGDARAYPLQILIWHEIVNDVVGDVPVVVTFCPLCNTALVFERPVIDDEKLTFGTSGNLRNSDLVMWDRQTESWWQQFTGEAIVGDLTGTKLKILPSTLLSWGDYKEIFPDGRVLSKETGFSRNYGANPYAGYDSINEFPFLFDGEVDDSLRPMTRILGFVLEGESVAYPLDHLAAELVINDRIADEEIVVFWKPGTASAVDTPSISDGRDVGTTGVFLRVYEDRVLSFTANEDGTFSDAETGSIWNILGTAIDGPLTGTELTAIPNYDTFWFAWAAFVPEGALRGTTP